MYQLNNRARRPESIYALNYLSNKNSLTRYWCKEFLAAVWNTKMQKTWILPAQNIQFNKEEKAQNKQLKHSKVDSNQYHNSSTDKKLWSLQRKRGYLDLEGSTRCTESQP